MNKKKVTQVLLDARVIISGAVIVIGFLIDLINQ